MADRLYIGNLSFDLSENEIRELFAGYGEVHSVQLITDRDTGRPRGFGFVEMENGPAAIEALDGREIGGRSLKVNEARERTGGGDRGSRPRW
jgi:RNA recognition motif-containing protein